MPTSCVVVDCYNHHQTRGGISFYCFPVDNLERRRKWISFVSRQNEDGSPWESADGDRVCSAHFISGKKSDDAGDPDFVSSVYPKTASKKARSAVTAELSIACFKHAKRRSLAKEVVELEERENHIARRKEEEKCSTFNRHVLKAYQHDHGSYCSSINHSPARDELTASKTALPYSLYLQPSWNSDKEVSVLK